MIVFHSLKKTVMAKISGEELVSEPVVFKHTLMVFKSYMLKKIHRMKKANRNCCDAVNQKVTVTLTL